MIKLPTASVCLLLGGVLAAAGVPARAQSSAEVVVGGESATAMAPDQVKRIYANAKPYMDDSLNELKRTVPELGGLKAAESQVSLQSILDRTAQVIGTQVPRIPDLTASESIAEAAIVLASPSDNTGFRDPVPMIRTSGAGQGRSMGEQMLSTETIGERQLVDRLHSSLTAPGPRMNFDYLVFYRPAPGGRETLEESRTDPKAVKSGEQRSEELSLHGLGFAHIWLMFLPERLPQSRYRLLGDQKMYGHETHVVAFAQLPDQVALPGQISASGRTYPLIYQGIIWIDQTTFRMVRLRVDLLAPLPDIQVRWLTSDLRFGEVRIPELNLPLWLPHQLELMWRQGDDMGGEMHVYTKYRLFHATAKIMPPS